MAGSSVSRDCYIEREHKADLLQLRNQHQLFVGFYVIMEIFTRPNIFPVQDIWGKILEIYIIGVF